MKLDLFKPLHLPSLNDVKEGIKDGAKAVKNEIAADTKAVTSGLSLDGVFGKIKGAVDQVDAFVHDHPKEAQLVKDGAKWLGGELQNVHLPGSNKSVAELFGIGKKNDRDQLADSTADLRKNAAAGRDITAQLAKMPANDPRRAGLEAQLATVDKALSKYGYTSKTAPKPGSLLIDPQFLGKELANGQVTASKFPAGTPVTKPPTAIDSMFAGGKTYSVQGKDGKPVTFKNAAEYQQFLSQNRTALGMPRTDGEPIGVQMNFEGGGGKGKRYGPALGEMASLGVIPTSVAGSSAGAIAASLVAAGADPVELNRFVTDPAMAKLYDINLGNVGGGLMDGNKAFDAFDAELRKLTGITDRPVTFADLKIPLQITATKMSDTAPEPGKEDMTQLMNRMFVFSQETTPNTPVALAVRASMAISAAFDPVQVVDPMTGRQMQFVDGGTIDNLPMRESPKFGLPVVGVSLASRDDGPASKHTKEAVPLRGGNLNVGNVILNGFYGKEMNDAAGNVDDWRDRTQPKDGHFMLSLPTWNLEDPSQGDSLLGFGYDKKVDPVLDQQTRQVTQDFFRGVLDQVGKPGAKGTNTPYQVPANLNFSREVQANGKTYVASYAGGDSVSFQEKGGAGKFDLKLGKEKIDAMYLDDQGFHDLASQLRYEAKQAHRL